MDIFLKCLLVYGLKQNEMIHNYITNSDIFNFITDIQQLSFSGSGLINLSMQLSISLIEVEMNLSHQSKEMLLFLHVLLYMFTHLQAGVQTIHCRYHLCYSNSCWAQHFDKSIFINSPQISPLISVCLYLCLSVSFLASIYHFLPPFVYLFCFLHLYPNFFPFFSPQNLPTLIGRFVPFAAVAAANCVNIPMMRHRYNEQITYVI